MIEPAAKASASPGPSRIDVAVDPFWIGTAGAACAPSGLDVPPFAAASTFMCCDPVASAIVSLVQLRNWKLTCASILSRICSSVEAGMPVITTPDLLVEVRVNSWIDPRLIQGAGGASRLKPPCCDGSKNTGACAVRLTGAKYARTRRATGASAENQPADIYSPCSW